ncbi:MAG: hypothetical protein M1828_002065 [Chrysothrix sp. TS-e1954]|nr:MAG: hypothetical protein M1828_002065 [Chrysothrix sp. TS-e1954]
MASSTTDPFHPAHTDLLQSLQTISSLISSHARIASASSSNPEVKESASDLRTAISDASADLTDLQGSVDAVAKAPQRFGLDDAEVQRRRGMVADVSRRLEGLRVEGERVLMAPSSAPVPQAAYPVDSDDEAGAPQDGYEEWETQQQEQLFSEQDVQLQGVGHTIGNLRVQADDMGREIGQQTMELEEVDNVVERVGGKIKTGRERVGDVLRRGEERCGGCCIGVLIAALIVLLILALVL